MLFKLISYIFTMLVLKRRIRHVACLKNKKKKPAPPTKTDQPELMGACVCVLIAKASQDERNIPLLFR